VDEKTLQAICGQLAEIQLQVEALRQVVLSESPRAARIYSQILEELYKDASNTRESIRKGIREGVVIQQFQDLGQGQLWKPADPPKESPTNLRPSEQTLSVFCPYLQTHPVRLEPTYEPYDQAQLWIE
jgi:hypothetical protein